jgi:prenyltransferase beta subunit
VTNNSSNFKIENMTDGSSQKRQKQEQQQEQQQHAKQDEQQQHTHTQQQQEFLRNKHIQYFVHCLKKLPAQYSQLDTNRLTLVHFAVQSLDILGFFGNDDDDDGNGNDVNGDGNDSDKYLKRYNVNKQDIIDWIYSLQIVSPEFKKQTNICNTQNNGDNDANAGIDTDVVVDVDEDQAIDDDIDDNAADDDNEIDDGNSTKEKNDWLYWQHAGFRGGTFLSPIHINSNSTDNTAATTSSSLLTSSSISSSTTSTNFTTNNENETQTQTNQTISNSKTDYYDQGHIAMTYTALCTLLTLGDDITKVDKKAILKSMKNLQQPNGSFQCRSSGSENDMRFLYCACAISYIFQDWSGMDCNLACDYIRSCISFDGAYGLIPGSEGHGGSTFCAVASLVLMGEIESELRGRECNHDYNDDNCNDNDIHSFRDELIQWCVLRQVEGMQGRPNKRQDTCYSYWIGGTLRLLECDHLLDQDALKGFVLGCQSDIGGFSKLEDGIYPDLLHSFYSLAWLSLSLDGGHDDSKVDYKGDMPREEDSSSWDKKNYEMNCHSPYDAFTLNRLDCSLGMCRRHIERFFRYKTSQQCVETRSSLLDDENKNLVSQNDINSNASDESLDLNLDQHPSLLSCMRCFRKQDFIRL